MLSGVERPLDEYGCICPDQPGVRRILDGAGDDVVRLSIGLETAHDLIRDLNQALGK
jgi:O-acetylhomoserine/O-acetylserine sulfhydrylase-like pyridoxal-dependent enzyme